MITTRHDCYMHASYHRAIIPWTLPINIAPSHIAPCQHTSFCYYGRWVWWFAQSPNSSHTYNSSNQLTITPSWKQKTEQGRGCPAQSSASCLERLLDSNNLMLPISMSFLESDHPQPTYSPRPSHSPTPWRCTWHQTALLQPAVVFLSMFDDSIRAYPALHSPCPSLSHPALHAQSPFANMPSRRVLDSQHSWSICFNSCDWAILFSKAHSSSSSPDVTSDEDDR